MRAPHKPTILVLLSALAVTGCVAQTPTAGGSAEAVATRGQAISLRRNVTLAVGQSAVVHGLRGECGSLPSRARVAEATADLNAQTNLGEFSFGQEGTRNSGSCGGATPARQTIFTARTQGTETLRVHGDRVQITVR